MLGILHLGKIKVGLAKAIPIAQGRSLQFVTNKRLPMQKDGEPFIQRPCNVQISLRERLINSD